MKSMIEKLQFWQQPEYHNYHVGAAVATLKEAESYIRELESALRPFTTEILPQHNVHGCEIVFVEPKELATARKVLG